MEGRYISAINEGAPKCKICHITVIEVPGTQVHSFEGLVSHLRMRRNLVFEKKELGDGSWPVGNELRSYRPSAGTAGFQLPNSVTSQPLVSFQLGGLIHAFRHCISSNN